jgi:hypothetical protein
MDTKPVTEVFPLDEGNESITQRRGWIKINIIGPLAKAGTLPQHLVRLRSVLSLRNALRTPFSNRAWRLVTIRVYD